MSDSDSNQDIKKRARRRLVGAAALALLGVILLPMAMDREPAPSGQELDVSIPDRNASQRPLTTEQVQVLQPQPQVVQPQTEVQAVPQPPVRVSAEPPVTNRPVSSVPSSPTRTPAQNVQTRTDPQPAQPQPAQRADDGDRARAILEGRTDTQVAAVSAAYVLQVAAFNNSTRANTMSEELRKQGYKAYVEKVGDISRVRVGPFSTKDEAEKAAASLRASGRNAVLSTR